jgi:hypothetical protein
MAMTKQQLLDDLAATYKSVDAPQFQETASNISWYLINVFETGKSEGKTSGEKPIGLRKNVHFYVYKEGDGTNEEAYYTNDEPINSSEKGIITDTGNLDSMYKLYISSALRGRVNSAVAKAANDVYNEDTSTLNHAVRLKWATDALTFQSKYIESMMWAVAFDSTVQTKGTTSTDNEIQTIVNGNIDKIASIEFLIPNPPTLTSPVNDATAVSVSPTFRWSTVNYANTYTLQLSTQSNFSDIIENETGIAITSHAVTGLDASSSYYWRVRSINGDDGLWSTINHFVTV